MPALGRCICYCHRVSYEVHGFVIFKPPSLARQTLLLTSARVEKRDCLGGVAVVTVGCSHRWGFVNPPAMSIVGRKNGGLRQPVGNTLGRRGIGAAVLLATGDGRRRGSLINPICVGLMRGVHRGGWHTVVGGHVHTEVHVVVGGRGRHRVGGTNDASSHCQHLALHERRHTDLRSEGSYVRTGCSLDSDPQH